MIKKFISIVFAFLMVFSAAALIACQKEEPVVPTGDALWEKYPEEYDNPADFTDPATLPGYSGRTVLKLMSWNLGTEEQNMLNRRMIKQFESLNPQYRVEILSYTDYGVDLGNLAASNKLPDVFMAINLADPLINKWLYDLSALTAADGDWDRIPAPVKNAAIFNGRVMAVPAEMHLYGLFVNDKIFEDANRATLEINPGYSSVLNAMEKLNSVGVRAGINNEGTLLEWGPAAFAAADPAATAADKKRGHYTWDGEKYNLESPYFTKSLDEMNKIHRNKWSFDSWTPQEQAASQSEGMLDLFRKNGIAMYFAPTYERNGILYGETGERDLLFKGELRYVGVPGGRNVIIPDIYGVGKTTQHAEAAYKLAKWLSFDPEGIDKRLRIDYKNEFISLPLTNDPDVYKAFFDKPGRNEVAGMKEVFETLDRGIVESTKILPGYKNQRWDLLLDGFPAYDIVDYKDGQTKTRNPVYVKNIYDDIWYYGKAGTSSWAEVKAQINTKVNADYATSVRALNSLYPKI